MNELERAELEAMRNDMVLTVRDALVKIHKKIGEGQFSLAGDYLAQAEMIVKEIEDN